MRGVELKRFENVYYFFGNTELDPNKFLNEIFIKEAENPIKSTDQNTPRPIVIGLEKTINRFTFTFKELDYNCYYFYQRLDPEKTVFKVSIVLNYTSRKEQAAHAFSELVRTIKIKKKSEFNMAVIKDSLSTYYSERLYSRLAFYERSMRALITAIFIPVYKNSWAEKLKDSWGGDIKGKGNKKELLEGMLETLDLSDLESIFFDEKLNVSVDNYDSEFGVHNIESLTKEELVKIIIHNRPVSLWEKEISKYAFINNAQKRMAKIREMRNIIAHNKSFTDKNFKTLKKELDFIIPKLNEAEDKILNEHDTQVLNETLKRIGGRIAELNLKIHIPALKEKFKALAKINTSIKQTFSKEMLNITKQLPKVHFDILNTLSTLPNLENLTKYKEDESQEDDNDTE